MTDKDDWLIELCLEEASKLPKNYPARVFAVAVDRKGLVITGRGNTMTKTHPTQKKWACFAKQPERQYLHAEVSTLISALKSGRTIDKLAIGRVDKQGNAKDAKPCPVCSAMLEQEFPDVKLVWSVEK